MLAFHAVSGFANARMPLSEIQELMYRDWRTYHSDQNYLEDCVSTTVR